MATFTRRVEPPAAHIHTTADRLTHDERARMFNVRHALQPCEQFRLIAAPTRRRQCGDDRPGLHGHEPLRSALASAERDALQRHERHRAEQHGAQ
ncbi:hypothetical protein [Bifidobacterium pseudolongum]|uniref:hypothetical protein n=1 Tax=Bifidobacterium pseudolongum TaxID=1694 RepID=UPI001178B8B1|nr:hypothetical protein [Bifidobacterium pseudolongum]